MKRNLLHKPIFHILLIIIVSLFAYSNTFHVPFQYDDEYNIVKNPVIKSLNSYIEPSKSQEFSFQHDFSIARYIGLLTLALNYKVHSLDVVGYHIVNLLIHTINALLVYFLVILTFSTPFLKHLHLKDYSSLIALFTALLFTSHPIQTQAVTYIIQRFASLATLFYLLSLVLYVMCRLIGALNMKGITLYAFSLFSAVLAMKTKEIAFTLPVAIALYEFMFFEGKIKRRLLYLIPLFLTMLIIPVSLIGLDKPIGDLIGDVSEATKVQTSISRLDYLFTQFRVIVTYIRLLFLPINQNLDYDYPLFHSLFNPEVFLSFLFLLSIFGLGIYLFYRSRNSAAYTRLISFGIFWFFVTLSVESSIIPIRDVIFEHRVYLPSIGLIVAISTSVFVVVENLKDRRKSIDRVVIGILAVIVVVLTGATYARNIIWKDEVSLWEDVVSKSPEKERGHNNLGKAYKSQGLLDKAIEQYQSAIELKPDFPKPYNNLANAYKSKGLIDKAIEQYQSAIRLKPDSPEPYNNLGVAYKSQGLLDKAIEQYQSAIELDPNFLEAHNNLGVAYKSQGLLDKTIEQYQIAIRLKPDFPEVHYNLGNVYYSKGLLDKTIEQYQIAIRLKPDWVKPLFSLGTIYLKKGNLKNARREFEKVLKINPKHQKARKFLNDIIQREEHQLSLEK